MKSPRDPLSAARGILLGVGIGCTIWLVIAWLVIAFL